MIEMPIFPDEQWYLVQVKKLFMNGNVADKNVEQRFHGSMMENELINVLSTVITPSDVATVLSGTNIFEKLVLAPFPVLKNIFSKFGSRFFQRKDMKNGKSVWVVKDEWKLFGKAYAKLISRHINIKLIEQYGIKCCPYCNENYIFNRKKKSGAQLDHFFSKEQYPLFALSLYNLVPSCTTCNHIKQEKKLKLSPHDHTRDFDHMRITYTPNNIQWVTDFHMLNIDFQYDPADIGFQKDMDVNEKQLLLKAAYQNHRDYAQEIINKAFWYNNTSMEAFLNSLSGAFESKEEILRIAFGNYVEQSELLKRPLSKMTRDLLIELKIL